MKMIDNKLFTVYEDGVRILYWFFMIKIEWIRGIAIGICHEKNRGVYNIGNWTLSSVVISIVIFRITIKHTSTYNRIPDRLNETRGKNYVP